MKTIFSKRYKDLIDVEHGESKDYICGEITYDVKKKLGEVLVEFAEPTILRPNRYNSYEVSTDAFHIALENLNKTNGFPVVQFTRNVFDGYSDRDMLGSLFAPWLFDLIELQYIELSKREKVEFQVAINTVFQENAIPWLLCDERMIKIDAQQFECDMRAKALMALHELKDSDSKFQAAYEELMKACEFLEKGTYAEAISNAGKSYESVLKVICGLQRGNSDRLTTEYVKKILNDLPATMSNEGFREKVMMALPFIRNNSSSDHGAGEVQAIITKPLAKLAINLSAAMNSYLIEEHSATLQAAGTDGAAGGEADGLPF
jgi:hypothetical protein